MAEVARKGARSQAAVDPEILAALNAGTMQTATLAESLAIDHVELLRAALPTVPADRVRAAVPAKLGVTRRMAAAAEPLLDHLGDAGIEELATHRSDTVRGWAAYMIARVPAALPDRLERLRPLADDQHFAVREWAWLALRPHLTEQAEQALDLLAPWTQEGSANLRRFAVEATRPRGVWAAHIPQLKQNPELGRPVLEPLRADPTVYVQDSVANWINDASKDQPIWARELCARWRAQDNSPATERICRRARRSLDRQ